MIVAEKPVAHLAEEPIAPMVQRNSIVLHGVSWDTYQALRSEESNNHVRMTYDHGELELMSPLGKHGKIATLLGLMIYEWTRLHRIEIESGGNMTCDRKDRSKGLEPDLCYWVTHQVEVRAKDEIDFLVDPPPDLALEVDVTLSSIPKLPIYETLRIPEVWRYRNGLEILRLGEDGRYVSQKESTELPGFPVKLAEEFIERRDTAGDTMLMEQFATAISGLPKR